MGNVIGQPLDDYVVNQIKARQKLHGSGVRSEKNTRTEDQLNILNSNTSWIKLASGVTISDEERLKDLGFTSSERDSLKEHGLAKKYVLFNGISEYNKGVLTQRKGFKPSTFQNVFNDDGEVIGATVRDSEDSSYIYSRYRNAGSETHGSDSGYSPMPGIISMEVKSLNRGSLEKAFVKIKAQNRQQLDILDTLYMRLGYTVLLEWGNTLYTTEGEDKQVVRNTIIEDKFFKFEGKRSYLDFIGGSNNPLIKSYKKKYNGNYDAMLAVISNFSWTFNNDGSYDIDLTLISLGDVIESLKSNISIDKGLVNYIKTYVPTESTTTDDPVEVNKDASIIHSMLWLFKRFGPNQRKITIINTSNKKPVTVGYFLKNGDEELTTYTKTYHFKYPKEIKDGVNIYEEFDKTFSGENPDEQADQRLQKLYKDFQKLTSDPEVQQSGKRHYIPTTNSGDYEWTVISRVVNTVPNPIDDAPFNTAFQLETITKQYYLKFHYLLTFIRNRVIPLIKADNGDAPIFDIDLGQWANKMYSLPNQISLDPKVCLVRNDNFLKWDGNISTVMNEIELFRAIDDKEHNKTTNYNLAYPLNIYLNFEFILNSLKSNQNERGDVNIYGFISSICTGLNKALGGINNLEPIIDKDTNTLTIIDSTPIPGISCPEDSSYELMLYGYKGSNPNERSFTTYESNFIRDINLKTNISPDYATMVTVGATANGYVKGTEATAFSVWNKGIVDRFKNELIPSNPSSQSPSGSNSNSDEAATNYVSEFLTKTSQCYGFSSFSDFFLLGNLGDLNDDIIQKNLSIVSEFYRYILAKEGQKSQQAGTIGFIPFKLSITMDGISGIKIYNKLNVNSSFLPVRYGKTLNFIITGVNHRLQNNDWETTLETIVMPKTSNINALSINIEAIAEAIKSSEQLLGALDGGTTYGVIGFSSVDPKLFPKALNKIQIESIKASAFEQSSISLTNQSQTTPNINNSTSQTLNTIANTAYINNLSIRERIVLIALSYVGQPEYVEDRGYPDPEFANKMIGIGWKKGDAWCGYFQTLVWEEAYTTGNAILPPAPQAIKNVWNTKAKNIPSPTPRNELTNGTKYKISNPVTEDQTYLKYIQPGDLAIYPDGHGEIVIKVKRDNSTKKIISIDTVGGNYSDRVTYRTDVDINSFRGFVSVLTP
jgi:hypothetical protein